MRNMKVTNEHIKWIEDLIPKMISGEVNIKEAMEIVNKNAIENNLPEIGKDTIKRYSFKLLEKNPEKQEQLKDAIKHNSGNRSSTSIERNRPEVISAVLEEDLPLIMARKTTLKEVAQKHNVSTKYISRIIENKLSQNEEEFNKYKHAIKQNIGTSPEKRILSTRKKGRVQSVETVANKEFLLLSSEEKKKQLIYKFLKIKLNEKENAQINSEEYVEKRIDSVVEYFLNRKNEKRNMSMPNDISKDDVLYILYRVPTLLNYSIHDKINPTIELLDTYEGIGYENTNNILKTFPSIIGYSIERKSKQLELLSKENLIDAIVDNPQIFMNSPQLLYAQIQYAKERHNTADLSNVTRSNIFMSGPAMLRLYGTSFDEIKQKYPLEEHIPTQLGLFSVQQIGKRTINMPTKDKIDCKIQLEQDEEKLETSKEKNI